MRSWYGELSEKNIEQVAQMIRERLDGKTFSIASASVVNRPDPRLELRTGCQFEPSWTDGSKEAVRVMKHKDGSSWLGFSAGHYFWSFHPSEREASRFSFDYDGFEVSFNAPCGDRHAHFFRAESGRDEALEEAAQVCIDMQTEDKFPPYRVTPYAEKLLEAARLIRELKSPVVIPTSSASETT